jgi:hypothetical protein
VRALQNDWILDTNYTNHATGMFLYFVDMKHGDFGMCGSVGGSVKFEGHRIVQIPIPGVDGKPTILLLFDIKYYL